MTNSQLSTTEPKKQNKTKNKLSKQLEQEQNHRNGDHMEGNYRPTLNSGWIFRSHLCYIEDIDIKIFI